MTEIALAVQDSARLGKLIGLFAIGIFAMPVVIALNLLTKLISAPQSEEE
jgi:hypothetical protein